MTRRREARVLGEAGRKRRKERTGGQSSERSKEEAQQDGGRWGEERWMDRGQRGRARRQPSPSRST